MLDSAVSVTLIIPCYNEKESIERTIAEIDRLEIAPNTLEAIIVDDGSNDGGQAIIDHLAASHAWLKVVRHEKNRGYGAALKSGIRRATGEFIVITDADGTYPNHMIPDLIAEMNDTDMVVGARTGDSVEYSAIRKIPKVFLKWYCEWITGRTIPDINSGLRVFRKSIAENFIHVLPNSFSFTTTITIAFIANNYLVKYIPIDYARRTGKSKIKPITDTLRFVQLIFRTGMYFAPLRTFAPVIAILFALFFASLAYDVFLFENLTDKTLVLLMLATNSALFALLADVIDKKARR